MSETVSEYSDAFHLEPPCVLAELAKYLIERDMLLSDEEIMEAASAGEGNMNHTLRIKTKERSFIAKQSPPWVAKYPQFSAPWDRVLVEAEFYAMVATEPQIARRMPRCFGVDEENRILFLEDIPGEDGDSVYGTRSFAEEDIRALAEFLSSLHGAFVHAAKSERMSNRRMRDLNHAHIFSIPLQPNNGLDLDSILPGLAKMGEPHLHDGLLRDVIQDLGNDVYLADGPCLVHGDFFPGSFLCGTDGVRVIDPEFGHFGFAEFDVGVFYGHMILAQQAPSLMRQFSDSYQGLPDFNQEIALQIAGCEIIRRLIGYAQLPLMATLIERARMLDKARSLVLEPNEQLLYSL